MKDQDEWLFNLKKGDEVAVRNRWGYKRIEIVKSITPTGFINLESGSRYMPDGTRKITKYDYETIAPATQIIKDALKESELRFILKNQDWGSLDLVALEKIYSIIQAATERDRI